MTTEARSLLTLLTQVFPDLSGEAAGIVGETLLDYAGYCEWAAGQPDDEADEPAAPALESVSMFKRIEPAATFIQI